MQHSLLFLTFAFATPFITAAAHAQKTYYQVDPVIFTAPASFETLGDETYVPKESADISPIRTSVTKMMSDEQMFPEANLGFPAGEGGIKYGGGRSIDDTQITTLGVPLNLPQGGGADLSIFPSFLWSRVDLIHTPISAGFAPSSASGAINLELWTRDQLLQKHHPEDPKSRLTGAYDRQVQNFSLATRQRNLAITGGMNYGLLTGPAGSMSYEVYRDAVQTWRVHFIGTDQTGDSPGSRRFPTPAAKIDSYRLIPILETQHALGDSWTWQSTWYGDVSGIKLEDPTDASSYSNSHTQQYGTENVFADDDYTFSLSARYTRFKLDPHTDQYGSHPGVDHDEWPAFASASKLFQLNQRADLKVTAQGTAVTYVGVAPGGRLSANIVDESDPKGHQFYELFTTAKMPTINSRYYQLPPLYTGNPNLKPERIYSAIAGYEHKYQAWTTRTILKGEYRNDVQIDQSGAAGATTINAGTGWLLYLDQEFNWAANGRLDLRNNILLSVSHLKDADIPYPDLPAFSTKVRAIYHFTPEFELEGRVQYQGPSVAAAYPSGGRFHPNYTLFDTEARFALSKEVQLQAGIENVTDSMAEVVLDYPLPGRLYYLGMQVLL